jgi:hypothetical protein
MPTLATIGPATIRAGASLSDAVDCSGSIRIARVIMPDAFDGADLTFRISPDGTAWHDLHNITIPSTGGANAYRSFEAVVARPPAGSIIVVPLGFATDVSWLKVRSGTALVPVPQSADRMFSFVCEMPDVAPAKRRAAGWAGRTGAIRLSPRDGRLVAVWRGPGRIAVTPPGPTGL